MAARSQRDASSVFLAPTGQRTPVTDRRVGPSSATSLPPAGCWPTAGQAFAGARGFQQAGVRWRLAGACPTAWFPVPRRLPNVNCPGVRCLMSRDQRCARSHCRKSLNHFHRRRNDQASAGAGRTRPQAAQTSSSPSLQCSQYSPSSKTAMQIHIWLLEWRGMPINLRPRLYYIQNFNVSHG
jgi:hypothetical protein